MKKKLLFIIIISVILSVVIFLCFKDTRQKILVIGSTITSPKENVIETTDILNTNFYLENYSLNKFLQNLKTSDKLISEIHNADKIILNIGLNEIKKDSRETNMENLETIIAIIRKYNQKDLYVLNYYKYEEVTDYKIKEYNFDLNVLSIKYNFNIIDINSIIKNNINQKLSSENYQKVIDKITEIVNKNS